jgi:purine-nucleoside phosphorylase
MAFSPDLLHPASAAASRAAAEAVRALAGPVPLEIGLVLGTGLGPLADEVEDGIVIPYADIPHFPQSGVTGHAGRLVIGRLAGRRVAMFQGRAHYYEHGDANAMRVPLEALAQLGAPVVLLTNSSGSLRPDIRPADLVALCDHINWLGLNPLIGDPTDHRFVNMVDAYDPALRAALRRAARAAGFDLPEGVYAWYSGPSFETPAEIRAARILGADLVGMSTVPEVILARRLGLRVAAVSMATNFGAGMDERETISHAQTKAGAARGAARMQALVRGFLAEMGP